MGFASILSIAYLKRFLMLNRSLQDFERTVYKSSDKMCPELKVSLCRWYKHPDRLMEEDSSINAEIIRSEIKAYLVKNVKRKILRQILDE